MLPSRNQSSRANGSWSMSLFLGTMGFIMIMIFTGQILHERELRRRLVGGFNWYNPNDKMHQRIDPPFSCATCDAEDMHLEYRLTHCNEDATTFCRVTLCKRCYSEFKTKEIKKCPGIRCEKEVTNAIEMLCAGPEDSHQINFRCAKYTKDHYRMEPRNVRQGKDEAHANVQVRDDGTWVKGTLNRFSDDNESCHVDFGHCQRADNDDNKKDVHPTKELCEEADCKWIIHETRKVLISKTFVRCNHVVALCEKCFKDAEAAKICPDCYEEVEAIKPQKDHDVERKCQDAPSDASSVSASDANGNEVAKLTIQPKASGSPVTTPPSKPGPKKTGPGRTSLKDMDPAVWFNGKIIRTGREKPSFDLFADMSNGGFFHTPKALPAHSKRDPPISHNTRPAVPVTSSRKKSPKPVTPTAASKKKESAVHGKPENNNAGKSCGICTLM